MISYYLYIPFTFGDNIIYDWSLNVFRRERTEVFRRAYKHISYIHTYYMVHITDLERHNAQHLKFVFTNT